MAAVQESENPGCAIAERPLPASVLKPPGVSHLPLSVLRWSLLLRFAGEVKGWDASMLSGKGSTCAILKPCLTGFPFSRLEQRSTWQHS